MDSIETKYWSQSRSAKSRGIGFTLTFEQWWDIWNKSGHWDQRGIGKGQYVMSRRGDIGPYEIGNVFIQTQAGNHKDSHGGNKWNVGKHMPDFVKKKLQLINTGRIVSPETCERISQAKLKYWADKKQGVING